MRNAITTKWNSPKVRIVSGNVSRLSTTPSVALIEAEHGRRQQRRAESVDREARDQPSHHEEAERADEPVEQERAWRCSER